MAAVGSATAAGAGQLSPEQRLRSRRRELGGEVGKIKKYTTQNGSPTVRFSKEVLTQARQECNFNGKTTSLSLVPLAFKAAALPPKGPLKDVQDAEVALFDACDKAELALLKGGWFSSPSAPDKAFASRGKAITNALGTIADKATSKDDIVFAGKLAADLKVISPTTSTSYAAVLMRVEEKAKAAGAQQEVEPYDSTNDGASEGQGLPPGLKAAGKPSVN